MSGILDGMRVLDFGRYVAGPYCATLLGYLGADVIRVERPGGGEDRFIAPLSDAGTGSVVMQTGCNKRSLTLNFRAPRSQEIVEKNSNLFTDLALKDVLIRPGLIMPWQVDDAATELQARRNEIMLGYMGPDFPKRPWRLWQLPLGSPELDAVVATLLQNARGATTAQVIAGETRAKAVEVFRQVDEYLANF